MVGGFGIQDQPSPAGGPNTRKSVSKVCCSNNELTAPGIPESLSPGQILHPQDNGGKTVKIDGDEYVLCGWMDRG